MAATTTAHQPHLVPIEFFGRNPTTDAEMESAIRAGLSTSALKQLQTSWNFTVLEISAALAIPRSTLMQMMRSPKKMTLADSDRLYRFAQVLALAERYIGDRSRALGWLRYPNEVLGSVTPLHALETEIGRQRVIQTLGVIAYGGVS
jgi:putative toxin-antitoxin system antitoxin component (TIGR02293 family)